MSRLLLASGRSREDLAATLRAAAAAGTSDTVSAPRRQSTDLHRAAIVAETPEQLHANLERAAATIASAADDRAFTIAGAIFYAPLGDPASRGRTAFLFPGFGVKRTTLLADLVTLFPFVERWLDALGASSGESFEPSGAKRALPTTMLDAVLLADLAMWVVLREIGVTCDDMAGHSFGENALLVAAGIIDDHRQVAQLLRDVSARSGPLLDRPGSGALGMLALSSASRPAVEPFLTGHPPRAFVSLDNCPNQMVVWGRPADLAELEAQVRARREVVFRLPELGQPVHTPLFPIPLADLRALYERVSIRPGRGATAWSAATLSRFPDDPARVRDLLAQQWLSPVRFRELVQRLYEGGVRTFVEVGPGDRLSGFVRDTLRGANVVAAATNMEGRATLTQLHLALAQLFVRGHDFDPALVSGHDEVDVEKHAVATRKAPASGSSSSSGKQQETETLVTECVASVLGDRRPALLDPERGFFELGLGSLGCIELAERLERALGRRVPQTWPFDFPTIGRLAAALEPDTPARAAADERVARGRSYDRGDIAVIGVGCRFPGADSPDEFFRLLMDGTDAVGEVPADRWHPASLDPQADEETRRRASFGAFLDDVRTFDAAFFGISPREALTLDPQQRLLLEVAWAALEHAAIDPSTLAGSPTGVFVGISNNDYAARLPLQERLRIGGYLATGNTSSTAAGRVSFFFGFRGPCIAIDTACSSSLAAVHYACQSLLRGDSRVALAGGVNLLVNPETTVFLSRARALSPTGRCRTFDEAADGYVRGEGCGMVVLKRLEDAVASGDRVLAVIRGTAMNHDGRTSGLTVPYGPAQEAVVREALDRSGLTPDDVEYVEAHGTATPLGDPIEINALARVFGPRDRARRPLRLGSVKTNIGHLEAAAGIASLIKAALQIHHGRLAPSLHFRTLNPASDAAARTYEVVTAPQAWNGAGAVGVSSFGISGTNVHVVMSAPPASAAAILPTAAPDRPAVLPLSAHSAAALPLIAKRLADRLEAAPADLGEVSRTLALGRRHFPFRRAIVARTPSDAIAQLRAIVEARMESSANRQAAALQRIAFLFTGQGAQMAGMGRELYEREPVFREAVDRCEAILAPLLGASLADVMFGGDQERLDRTEWTQPALFVFEYALAALWQSWGVRPAAVLGHSVGEFVAACVAGVFSLEDGLHLVAARGRLMQELPSGGAMLAVYAGVEQLERLSLLNDGLALAAINASDRIVLSGPSAAVRAAAARLRAEGIASTPLAVSHAFHSPLMEPMLDRFRAEASRVAFSPPSLPLYSNLTGRRADAAIASADYWRAQVREPVRFAGALDHLVSDGITIGLEIGPRPVLATLAARLPAGSRVAWIASEHAPAGEHDQVLDALARLYENGAAVNWAALHGGARAVVDLPTYPFQRETFWIEADRCELPRVPAAAPNPARPLLGVPRPAPGDRGQRRFETVLRQSSLALLEDAAVLPPSAYAALALALAAAVEGRSRATIKDLRMALPLVLDAGGRTIQTLLAPAPADERGLASAEVFSRAEEGDWIEHASWQHAAAQLAPPDASELVETEAAAVEIDGAEFYRRVRLAGVDVSDQLRVVRRASFGRTSARARLGGISPTATGTTEDTTLLPLFDGCFQVLAAALIGAEASSYPQVRRIGKIAWLERLPEDALIAVAWRILHDGGVEASITIVDPISGSCVAEMRGIEVVEGKPVSAEPGRSTAGDRLRHAKEEDKLPLAIASLQAIVGTVLHLPADRPIEPSLPFNLAGFDSLMALQTSTIVRRELDVRISAAAVLDCGCVEALARAVLNGGDASESSAPSLDVVAASFVDGEL